MKLNRLTLRNFKGVKDFTLEAKGEDITVMGDNATGKTTIFDAFNWLLFNKDSQNKADFEIKTLDENNKPVHGLEHEVEASLGLADGKELTLKKAYKEKWTRKKGAPKAVFTGHETKYHINGVPEKKKEFESTVNQIVSEDTFRLLTSPGYFNEQLHWKDRRNIILQVCGDVTDQEVIATNKELEPLNEILGDKNLEDHRKMVREKMKEVNDELQNIPIRIDEISRGLPDVTEYPDPEFIKKKISELKKQEQSQQQEINRIKDGGEAAEKTKQLRELESEIIRLKNECQDKVDQEMQEKKDTVNALRDDISQMNHSINNLVNYVKSNKERAHKLETENKERRENWKELHQSEFAYEDEAACPTCGQDLPEEQVKEARLKAHEAFNEDKATKIEKIKEEGKKAQEEINNLNEAIKRYSKEIQEIGKEREEKEKEVEGLQKEVDMEQENKGIEDSATYKEMLNQKDDLEKSINELKEGKQEAIEKIEAEIEVLKEQIDSRETMLGDYKQIESAEQRIEELKQQEKDLSREYEKLEKELYLTDEFEKKKVEMIEKKINYKFKYARFKMFNTLINGGIEGTCETLYEGVPYLKGLNAGHRIIVGLDIIRTLSEHYNFAPPIFIDNAESVSELPEIESQLIRLVKPEIETEADRKKYSKLVVQLEPKKQKEAV